MAKAKSSALTVGLDAKRAVHNRTGLGNYSRYCINIMSAAYPSTRFRLYTPSDVANSALRPLLARDNVELINAGKKGIAGAWWRTFDLPLQLKSDGVDIYHGLSNELPLTVKGICPTVVTIHDVIYRRYPSGYSAIDRRLYDFKYGRSARNATRIIAISRCTKEDLIDIYGIDPAKIDVIYQGVDPVFTLDIDTAARQRVRSRYKLPQCYILSVGTLEPRKNQLLAVRALARLPRSVSLVIIGRSDTPYGRRVEAEISRLGLSDRVLRPGSVDFTDLPAIYADAALASYTSRYEGFGLPVAEALTVGTPVIACTGSCLEEAGGDGGVYVHPDDIDAYVDEAQHLLDDRVWAQKKGRLGKQHVRHFSAEAFAKATMATYNKAIIDFII